jgi:hypothetical protein
MNSEFGKRAIKVTDTEDVKKESIDALVEPGVEVEVDIEKGKENQQIIEVPADRVNVL